MKEEEEEGDGKVNWRSVKIPIAIINDRDFIFYISFSKCIVVVDIILIVKNGN
jgi:hypothetical protein